MKEILFFISFIIASVSAFAQTGVFRWAKPLDGISGIVEASSVTIDNSGNILTTGRFKGMADFDPGTATVYLTSSGNIYDIFITKSDASGNLVWTLNIGGPDVDEGKSIATDGTGNVYVCGTFQGTVDFDPGAGVYNLTAGTNSNRAYMLKLDPSGNFIWAKTFTTVSTSIVANSIKLDASGNIYTAGSFVSTVDFDPGSGSYSLTAAGAADGFILKLDASGNFVWARSLGGSNADIVYSMAIDGAGNVLSTGTFSGTSDFDPGTGAFNLTSSGLTDIFICKIDGAGNFIWANQVGGTGTDVGNSIAIDASNNVFTTGNFAGTVDFDPGAGIYNLSGGVFVLKLDASGIFTWANAFSGSTNSGYSIAVDGLGNILTTGRFYYTTDFDPGAGTFILNASGGSDVFVSKLDNSGNFVWAKGMGGLLSDDGKSIVIDASNNIIITGNTFSGVIDLDPGPGTFNIVTSDNSYSQYVLKLNSSGNFSWANSAGVSANATVNDICLDASGNIISIGIFVGTVDFDAGSGIFNLTSTLGTNDIFVTKYDSTGNFVWAKKLGGQASDVGSSVEVDGSGNIYSTGSFTGTVDFDPGAPVLNLTNSGGIDIFILKLNVSGNFVWAKKVGGSSNDHARSLSLDPSGNILMTGFFLGTVDFDPGAGTSNLVSPFGVSCAFILKLNSSGNFTWAKKFSAQNFCEGLAVETDLLGNVITAGTYSPSGDFDPGTGTYNLTSNGNEDIYISKLDASGNFMWAKSFGNGLYDDVMSLASDALGNISILGNFEGSVDFDPGAGIFDLTTLSGGHDIFVSRLDSSGNFLWAKKFGSYGEDNANSITTDNTGNSYFAGCYSIAQFNVVIHKLDVAGNSVWEKIIGGTEPDIGYAIAVDPSLNVYTAGTFIGTSDFNPDPFDFNLTTMSTPAAFIQKMAQCNLPAASISPAGPTAFCSGGNVILNANTGSGLTYQWQNNLINITGATNPTYTVTTAGYYRVVVTNSCGPAVSSEVTITMNPLPSAVNNPGGPTTFCPGGSVTLNTNIGTGLTYQWKNNSVDIPGQTASTYIANTSGSYTVVVTNANNCSKTSPAVVVTVNSLPTAIITPVGPTTFCSFVSVLLNANTGTGLTYQWKNNGVNIFGETSSSYTANAAGNYTVVVSNPCGTVTSSVVAVTANTSTTTNITASICPGNSYTLPDGQVVSTTGSYSTHISTGAGCDSLVIVNLTVNDLVAPVVSNCPADFTSCSPVSWIPPQFTDNCFYTVTSNYVPGSFFPQGVHTITYSATDAGNNTTTCSFNVTVLAAPVLPDSLISDRPYNNICANQNITLTVSGGSPGFLGTWEWFTGSCGGTPLPAFDGMSTITVSPLATTTYFVRGVLCNTTVCLSLTVKVNNTSPGTLSVVSMPPMGYVGGSGTITCNTDPNAVFYVWRLQNGSQNAVLFNGSIGPVETVTNSVNVDFMQAQNKYNIRIFSGNACGRSNYEMISIKGTVEPAACLNGPVIVCPLQNATYSVVACPIPNATGYQWTIQPPSAGTIVSGQGSTTINVHFATGYTSAEICVAGLSQSSIVGPATCVTVAPSSSVAGAITGDVSPCANTTENYNVLPVAGATGYLWTTTIPGAVVSGTSTTGTVQFPAGPFTGNLCVQSLTTCGPSLPSCTPITAVIPGVPGPITGPVSNLCGASNLNYSLSTNNANNYTWILPPGIVLVSGGNSNSINVNYSGGTIGPQTITVQATYNCNNASSSIIVDGTPGMPNVTPATICAGTDQFYSASSGGPNMTYLWTTTGSTTSYCTNPSCSQFYVEWLQSGCTLSVIASNSCGTSAVNYVPNSCRIVDDELPETRIYPNPSYGEFILEFESYKADIRNILITDQTGRVIMKEDISSAIGSMQHHFNLGNVEPGIYNVTMKCDDGNFWMERITLIR